MIRQLIFLPDFNISLSCAKELTDTISAKKINRLRKVTSSTFSYTPYTILHLMKGKFFRKPAKNDFELACNPYAIHGSFMVFNKSFFEKGGTLNYPSFLFGEELFIAETVRKLNLIQCYEPSLKINHNEHATTGVIKSKEKVAYLNQSYTYLLTTFFSEEK